MTVKNHAAALAALSTIRECQARADKSFSPLTKADEAQKAAIIAIHLVEFLLGEVQELKGALNG
jgi:hypothetical protein